MFHIKPINILTCLILALLVMAPALLALESELRLAIPLLVGVTATMAIVLACALHIGERYKIYWSPTLILTVALLLRLLFLFAPPQLSDDIYRYLWDGSSLLSGSNPYAAAPSAVRPSPPMAAVHSRINHPDYGTIYPPMAQIVFASGAALGGTITGLKTFLAAIDMGLCALLIVMLKRLKLPVWRSVLYAWNPLPVLEIAGSGHVDGAGMALLLAAIFLLFYKRKTPWGADSGRWPFLLSGALLACAGLVKLLPFVFAPLLLVLVPAGRRRHFMTGCIATMALLMLPFLPHLANILSSLDAYAHNWEFAGCAFNVLRTLTGSGSIARLLLSACFLLILSVTTYRLDHGIKQATSISSKESQILKACYVIALAFLLLTPTLQPWYALSLAAFLPFCAGPAGLVLCWAVFLTYQVQIPYFISGQWTENPLVTAAVFLAPLTAYLLSRVFSNISRQGRSARP